MPAIDVDPLRRRTEAELGFLAEDPLQPKEVRREAQRALESLAAKDLAAAVQNWQDATHTFAELTATLLAVTEKARANPVGEAVAVLNPILRTVGETLAAVGGLAEHEPPPGAGGDKADPPPLEAVPAAAAAMPAAVPPPPGTVRASTKLAEIADEYVAMFEAATIAPARKDQVDRLCDRAVAHQAVYEGVGNQLAIPWHFIAIVHCLEANANFGLHLHNGDPLAHRTRQVPKDRPPADVAQPPFSWSTSAVDALTYEKLNALHDWSLPAYLHRLERYNGFGYRKRGLVSPYLWSFSDRYVRGKFVVDGAFDPNAVSKQCGGAVILHRLIERRDVQRI